MHSSAAGGEATGGDMVLRSLGMSVIVTDLEGIVTGWNPAATDLYGWTAAEALGRHLGALVVLPADHAAAASNLQALSAGEAWSGELPARHKDGRVFPVRISKWPVVDPGGGVVGIVGFSEEVTVEHLGRAKLRQLAAVLEEDPRLLTDRIGSPGRVFDADAVAVEIVTRAFDPELRADVDADPHGTVLPPDGLTLGELHELLASLVAMAVHTASVAADRSDCGTEQILAAAALRLRDRF